ncbi:hypothetical protein BN903_7 [Halorubrum sp. AJ67]|nr:hypothetical protein BN903_7 [Halorubrum sp. AJ67]
MRSSQPGSTTCSETRCGCRTAGTFSGPFSDTDSLADVLVVQNTGLLPVLVILRRALILEQLFIYYGTANNRSRLGQESRRRYEHRPNVERGEQAPARRNG